MPVSDETPFAGESPAITASQASSQLSQLCRLVASDHQLRLLSRNRSLVASDRQLRGFRDGIGCHSPDDRLFLRWGAGAPQSLVDSLSSLSRELVDARRFSSDLQGRIAPLHGDLEFRLIGNDSLLLLQLVHLCLGDNHTPSHLTSLPQIRPGAHFAQGGDSPPPPPPHKRPRLPIENSSDDERKSSAVLLLPDEGEGDKENCRPAPLALLLDYIMSKFPVASRPLARPSIRLPDNISFDHGSNSSAGLLQPDKQEGNEENSLPASLALLVDYIISKFSSRLQALGPAFQQAS